MSTGNISKKRKVRTHDTIRSSERVGDARGASPGAHPAMTGVRVANRVLRPAARSPPGVRDFQRVDPTISRRIPPTRCRRRRDVCRGPMASSSWSRQPPRALDRRPAFSRVFHHHPRSAFQPTPRLSLTWTFSPRLHSNSSSRTASSSPSSTSSSSVSSPRMATPASRSA